MLEPLILGMILENDLTGYDIKKLIENNLGVFYKTSFGSLYPALRRLTQKGHVTTYEESQGKRQKIFYHITEEGKSSFLDWISTPMNIFDGTNTNLAKVYFFDRIPLDIRERKLQEYEINNINYLHQLEMLEKQFSQMDNMNEYYYKLSTLYYGISITQKTIEWCRHIQQKKPLPELIGR